MRNSPIDSGGSTVHLGEGAEGKVMEAARAHDPQKTCKNSGGKERSKKFGL